MKTKPQSPSNLHLKYNSYDLKPKPGNSKFEAPTPKSSLNNLLYSVNSKGDGTKSGSMNFEKLKTNIENSLKPAYKASKYQSSIYANYKKPETQAEINRPVSGRSNQKLVYKFFQPESVETIGKVSMTPEKKLAMNKYFSNDSCTKKLSMGGELKDKFNDLLERRLRKNRDSIHSQKQTPFSQRDSKICEQIIEIKEPKGDTTGKKSKLDVYNSNTKPSTTTLTSKYNSHEKERLMSNPKITAKNSMRRDEKPATIANPSYSLLSNKIDLTNKFAKKLKAPRLNYQQYLFSSKTHKGYSYFDMTKKNQDSYFVINKFLGFSKMHLIGVCDGHGQEGRTISAFVKELFPQMFEEALRGRIERNNGFVQEEELYKNNQYEIDVFEALKNTVNKLFSSDIDVYFSGTTFNCIFIFGSNIIICNVGDSRAITSSASNFSEVVKLSKDHKPSDPQEKARLLKRNARIEQIKNDKGESYGPLRVWLPNEDQPGLAMTRSIGDLVGASIGITWKPYVLYKELDTNNEYAIVLATDGVWDVLSNSDVMGIVKKHWMSKNIDKAAEELLQESVKRWSVSQDVLRDDITFIISFICK